MIRRFVARGTGAAGWGLALVLVVAVLGAASEGALAQVPEEGGGPLSPASGFEQRLSALEAQVQTMTGASEQTNHTVEQVLKALQRLQSDTDARLTKLEATPTPVASAPATPPPSTPKPTTPSAPAAPPANPGTESAGSLKGDDAKGTLGALTVQDGKVTRATNTPKAPPLPPTSSDGGLTAREQYEKAFGLLRQADYAAAEAALKGFITKNPQNALVGNARYWYAETFYVRNRFDEAAVAFAEAYQQDPHGSKAPDSLFKMALALAGLHRTADACATLDDLTKNHPTVPPALRVRINQERARMTCSKAH